MRTSRDRTAYNMTMTVPREDLVAGLAARRELGPDYDAAFAEVIAARIEEQLAARQAGRELPR
ncbi:hypothetical protein DZF91_35385, partial [Actinomadura logoneensis]